MSWKSITVLGLLVALAVASILAYLQYQPNRALKLASTPPKAVPKKASQELGMLAERVYALVYRQTTPAELEEEERYNQEQALALVTHLQDQEMGKRLQVVEQLGAYPGPDSARLLTNVLETDGDSAVREMAAQILSTVDPDTSSIDALLDALKDPFENVQHAALLTLEEFLSDAETSELELYILNGLEQESRSKVLNEAAQDTLQELLSNFQSVD